MASYLDNYGKSEARRENILKGLLIAVAVIAVASGALYFFLRDFKERRQLSGFHELLFFSNPPTLIAICPCIRIVSIRNGAKDFYALDMAIERYLKVYRTVLG